MKFHNFFYEEPDGLHYPDTFAGAEEVYEVDFSRFLDEEKGILVEVAWRVSSLLTLGATYVDMDNPTVASAVISTPFVGSHKVRCTATFDRKGVLEYLPIDLIIKVH